MKIRYLFILTLLLASCNNETNIISPNQQTLGSTFTQGNFWVYSVIDSENSYGQKSKVTLDTLVITNLGKTRLSNGKSAYIWNYKYLQRNYSTTLYVSQSIDTLFIYRKDLSEFLLITFPLQVNRSWKSSGISYLIESQTTVKTSLPFYFNTYKIRQGIYGLNEFKTINYFIDPNFGIIKMDLNDFCTVCSVSNIKVHWQLIDFKLP